MVWVFGIAGAFSLAQTVGREALPALQEAIPLETPGDSNPGRQWVLDVIVTEARLRNIGGQGDPENRYGPYAENLAKVLGQFDSAQRAEIFRSGPQ